MLASLDKLDHAAVVGWCAHRAEISVARPPKRDSYARTASEHRLGRTLFWKLRPPLARSNRSVTG
jgi:hypothetical protein